MPRLLETREKSEERALLFAILSKEPLELKALLQTSGVSSVGTVLQSPRLGPDPDYYLGQGKIEEMKSEIARLGASVLVCDDELSPRQERNLERIFNLPVLDRTAVILDIFARGATSSEAQLAVELAQLRYNMTRMRGLWTHLERLGAGIATRGPGESQIETDRRLARKRISFLEKRLRKIKNQRGNLRRKRKRSGLFEVALVGYTNARKTTLANLLAEENFQTANKLFHTLEPRTRKAEVLGQRYLLSDTVGFINKLPHQLVESFHSTLGEVLEADILLHVVDASGSIRDIKKQIRATRSVLTELGVEEKPEILVLNKVDLISSDRKKRLRLLFPGSQLTSKEEVNSLEEELLSLMRRQMKRVQLLFPWQESSRLHTLYQKSGALKRRDTGSGVYIDAFLRREDVFRFLDLQIKD